MGRPTFLAALASLLLAGSAARTGVAAPAPTSCVPVAGPYVFVRTPWSGPRPPTLPHQTPAQPAKGCGVLDPHFRMPVVRATDRVADRLTSPAAINEYARVDPENADGTRLLLRGTDGVWWLYALPSFERLPDLDLRNSPDGDPRWDAVDPNVLWFLEGSSLWRHDVAANANGRVHDFAGDDARCVYVSTRTEGDASLDRRFWCLFLCDEAFTPFTVVCYDRAKDAVVGRLKAPPGGAGWDDVNWVSMSMSGSRCVLGMDSVPSRCYARDFSQERALAHRGGHADLALTAAGRDVLVYQDNATDALEMCDLETGAVTPLLPIPFGDNPDLGLHVSGNAAATPGWVLVSTHNHTPEARSWMDQALFLLQLAPDPVVWRIAQTYQLQDAAAPDYFGEAFATINRAGTRLWWGANWRGRGAAAERYETYMVALPSGWRAAAEAFGRSPR